MKRKLHDFQLNNWWTFPLTNLWTKQTIFQFKPALRYSQLSATQNKLIKCYQLQFIFLRASSISASFSSQQNILWHNNQSLFRNAFNGQINRKSSSIWFLLWFYCWTVPFKTKHLSNELSISMCINQRRDEIQKKRRKYNWSKLELDRVFGKHDEFVSFIGVNNDLNRIIFPLCGNFYSFHFEWPCCFSVWNVENNE